MIDYLLPWHALNDYFALKETGNSSVWGYGGTGKPPPNHVFLYAKDKAGVSNLYWKNDAGTEFDFSFSAAHNLLSATHSDTLVGTVVRGDLVVGNSTPKWARLARGSSGQLLRTNSSGDLEWVTVSGVSIGDTIGSGTTGSVLFIKSGPILGQDNATFFWDTTNKRLGIGTASPSTPVHILDDAGSNNNLIRVERYGGAATNPNVGYQFFAARGTLGTPAALAVDDTLLRFVGFGYGTSFLATTDVALRFKAAEAFTGTAHGTYITLETTPIGSTTVAERFRVGPSGQWGIGGATYGSAGAYFRSGGASAAPVWSTLILPNSATANYIAYATSSNTWGESSNLQFDGTDFILGSGIRARMASQNRFRHLNMVARATKITTAQALTTDTVTAITLNSETFDTDTIHDNSTNNTRLTAPIAGKYLVLANCEFANGSDATQRLVGIRQDGGTIYGQQRFVAENGDVAIASTAAIVSLAATGYVELIARHKHGSDLNVNANENTSLAMFYIGE